MAERKRNKFTPVEEVFSDLEGQNRVTDLLKRLSGIEGVLGLTVGYFRNEPGRTLYVLVGEEEDVMSSVTDAVNEVFPDRISKRQLPCEMVTEGDMAELKEEFHNGRKMVFATFWKR